MVISTARKRHGNTWTSSAKPEPKWPLHGYVAFFNDNKPRLLNASKSAINLAIILFTWYALINCTQFVEEKLLRSGVSFFP